LKQEYELAKKKIELKEQIEQVKATNFEILTSNPLQHARQYLLLLGEFRKALDAGDVNTLKNIAKELKDAEKLYADRLEVLNKVLEDPDFQKIAKGKNEAIEEVVTISRRIAIAALGTANFFYNIAQSVGADPYGWMRLLPR
jgi:hypothetical protein